MDGLRWVLLIVGSLVVLGVFLYSRRNRNEPADASSVVPGAIDDARPLTDRQEPSIGAEGAAELAPQAGSETETGPDPDLAPEVEQKIVTMRVVGANKVPFAGDELVLSLRGIGMRHGRFGIFHRYDGNDEDRVVFSAASLVEPGSFDLENIKGQKIPGISLFMVLPGPIDGAEAFDLMMAASRTLTQSLGAELLDETGSTLSIQRERYLREEVIEFEHSNLVA